MTSSPGTWALLGALALTSCPTSRSSERCVLVASEASPPVLTPAAANPVLEPVRMRAGHPSPVRCNGKVLGAALDAGAGFYPDDPVDDLTAIVKGSGMVDGQSRVVCPAFPSSLTPEPAGILQMPCGPTACPNKQLVATEHGMSVHMLFYDDPGLHIGSTSVGTSGAHANPETIPIPVSCYYRLLALSVSWEGKAPQ